MDIIKAIEDRNFFKIKEIIDDGCDLNIEVSENISLLQYAIKKRFHWRYLNI